MTEFTFLDDLDPPEEDNLYPNYGVPGRIIFEVYPATEEYEPEIEVVDYDGETSVYWLHEGTGIDYWLEHDSGIDFTKMAGKYIMTVNGEYIKGQTWRESPVPTDDDENWWIEKEPVPTDLESLL